MVPHYFPATRDKDIVDMDTKQRIRYMSDSSMSGTSGYSTTSPGPGNSPISSGNSPVPSPASLLPSEFSNLSLPQAAVYPQPSQYQQMQTHSINQLGFYDNEINMQCNFSANFMNASAAQVNYQSPNTTNTALYTTSQHDYPAKLRITEQPVEKFRFRYKSEMHGTHGSLSGTSSNRSAKSFPEVELCDYKGPAIIRCSLFQTGRVSPHSHQLVVRKDEHDICDPHEIKISEELGYFAEFKNMGIIHTAKKFIVEELLKKKRKRLQFELGREDLTTREDQELYKQTEKEAKDMNLNQVRLCFEAFGLDSNNLYTPIAAPVYSNAINNRKSAQTGELRITRLSIVSGSVMGGQDLILLVEKVSKKNIKVRFFEMNDDELVWEAFATFRESDVHHQYAICCRTPPYKDKDIDKTVEVFIELMRPSDDERSYPPSSFRYKPREQVILRKRKRTCSTASGSSGSQSGSLSSGDIPKTVQHQQQQQSSELNLSAELDKLLTNPEYKQKFKEFSEEGFHNDFINLIANEDHPMGTTEKDGAPVSSTTDKLLHYKKIMISKKLMDNAKQQQKLSSGSSATPSGLGSYMQKISEIYNAKKSFPSNSEQFLMACKQISNLYKEHAEKLGESLMNELVINDNIKFAMILCHTLRHFKLEYLFNEILNTRGQTPLHCACLLHRPQYIRPLLSLGCNPNIADAAGDTAIHLAVREVDSECFDCLVNSKTSQDLQLKILNDEGFTALHLAIRENNNDMASKLIKLDKNSMAVPNSADGNNALHMAVQQQNLALIKIILENQSLTILSNACNTAGFTPLDVARQLTPSNKESAQILSLLLTNKSTSTSTNSTVPFSDLDDSCSNLVIKEEEQSSSSTEDDEDDEKLEKMSNTEEIQIKEEEVNEVYFEATDLQKALEDKEIYSKLCIALTTDTSWKKTLDIPDYHKSDAGVMLNYIKRNVKTINCQTLAFVIQKIDTSLIGLIKK